MEYAHKIEVHGYKPNIGIREIFKGLFLLLGEASAISSSWLGLAKLVSDTIFEKHLRVVLIIHNLDGSLRGKTASQPHFLTSPMTTELCIREKNLWTVLLQIAATPTVHILATIDNPYATVFMPSITSVLWYRMTTYRPYTHELTEQIGTAGDLPIRNLIEVPKKRKTLN